VEESQGKYSSHQIDAIKGIEAVKAASAESAFVNAMLNEFLSVSQKLSGDLHRDVVRQCFAEHRSALYCDLFVGRRDPSHSWDLSVGGFCRVQLTDGDGLRGNFARARSLGQPAKRRGPPESAERYFRAGARTGP